MHRSGVDRYNKHRRRVHLYYTIYCNSCQVKYQTNVPIPRLFSSIKETAFFVKKKYMTVRHCFLNDIVVGYGKVRKGHQELPHAKV